MKSALLLSIFALFISHMALASHHCEPDNEKTFTVEVGAGDLKTRMFYGIVGDYKPELPVIFVIPGGPGGNYQDVVEALKGLPLGNLGNIVSFDHRGIGCTRKLNPQIPEFVPGYFSLRNAAGDIQSIKHDLMARGVLAPEQKWFVLGISYGGMVAQSYAIEYGDKADGLIIGSTRIRAADHMIAEQDVDRTIFRAPGSKELYEQATAKFPELEDRIFLGIYTQAYTYKGQLVGIPNTLNTVLSFEHAWEAEAYLYQFRDWWLRAESSAGLVPCENVWYPLAVNIPLWERCRNLAPVNQPFDFSGKLKNVQTRTLVMAGGFDHITSVESNREIHAELPNSVYWENPYATHGLRADMPGCFMGVLAMFINSEDKALDEMISVCRGEPQL